MTDEALTVFTQAIESLYLQTEDFLPDDDTPLGRLLLALAEMIDHGSKTLTQDDIVKSCLDSSAEHLRHAALDYYVSTK